MSTDRPGRLPGSSRVPDVGVSSPARQASRVDLPEPGGPVTATTSPARPRDRSAATVQSTTARGHAAPCSRFGYRGTQGEVGMVDPEPAGRLGPRRRGRRSSSARPGDHHPGTLDEKHAIGALAATPRPGARRQISAATLGADPLDGRQHLCSCAGSRFAVGSSSRSRSGSATAAAATARSCCCPPLSRAVSRVWSTGQDDPGPAHSSTRGQISAGGTAAFSSGKATSSPIRSMTMLPSGSCWTRPTRGTCPPESTTSTRQGSRLSALWAASRRGRPAGSTSPTPRHPSARPAHPARR